MLGSNNYLGLTGDERVKRAAIEAVERYGTGCTGSRLMNGTLSLHRELEDELADWMGTEAALVFTAGYLANMGLLSTLVEADDAVFLDSAGHASLIDGARLCNGVLRSFRHNLPIEPASAAPGLAGQAPRGRGAGGRRRHLLDGGRPGPRRRDRRRLR